MKNLRTFLLASLLVTSAVAQPALDPANFAQRSVIQIADSGPFHQLSLPLEVYQGLVSSDLSDLRVFNGKGEVMSYAIRRREIPAEALRTEQTVPFFPLISPAMTGREAGDIAVTVRQGGDGTLVSVRQSTATAGSAEVVRGLVLDASQLKGSIRSLRLLGGASAIPFHAYTIESSKDLQHWRMLKRDAQLVRLAHAGHRIDHDGAEWDSPADRYLRLLWADPQRAPAIASVLLGSIETRHDEPQLIWSGEIRPGSVQGGIYEYAWPGQMPLERLRINLAQINTLVPLVIQYPATRLGRHRHRDELRWENLAHSVAYRLESPQGEICSADINLHGSLANRVRLSLDARGGSLGEVPPTLQIGFVPQVIVFLARGDGPFVLAWGANALGRADLPLTTLLPGYDGTGQLPAAVASLETPTRAGKQPEVIAGKRAPEATTSSNKWILWLVLLGGLLILGGMATMLTRQLRQGSEPKP